MTNQHKGSRRQALTQLEEQRRKVHLKTIGAWIALVVCVASVVIAWSEATRLVWLSVTPFAAFAVWISLRTEKDLDGQIRLLQSGASGSGVRAKKASTK